MPEFLYAGNCVDYQAVTTDIIIGCKGEGEQFCYTYKCCLALGESPLEVGLEKQIIDNGYVGTPGTQQCKIKLFILECGIKIPEFAIKADDQCFCCLHAASFPFGDKVPEPVCACCFIRICPCKPGILMPPSGGSSAIGIGGAPETPETMKR